MGLAIVNLPGVPRPSVDLIGATFGHFRQLRFTHLALEGATQQTRFLAGALNSLLSLPSYVDFFGPLCQGDILLQSSRIRRSIYPELESSTYRVLEGSFSIGPHKLPRPLPSFAGQSPQSYSLALVLPSSLSLARQYEHLPVPRGFISPRQYIHPPPQNPDFAIM